MSPARLLVRPERPATRRALLAWVLIGVTLAACRRADPPDEGVRIATTTSYLEAAARELLGEHLSVLRLAEPGTCPGHFDLRPSQVAELRHCRALLRFDFQKSLDAKLAVGGSNGLRIAEITLAGGMGLPESYLAACRQAADHFVALGLLSRADAETRLQAAVSRLDTLARDATHAIQRAGLAGAPVIASSRQRDFCEWLGLKVVAAFRAADAASVSEIEEALAAGRLTPPRFVIANLPEGRRTPDALAERLQAPVVVFGNFPALEGGRVSFDALVAGNVRVLTQAALR